MPTSMLGIANKAPSDQKITLVLLRKRVFTKSPVRENRTPGSVRGLSGNGQSYRNQLSFEANGNAQFLPKLAGAKVCHTRDRASKEDWSSCQKLWKLI